MKALFETDELGLVTEFPSHDATFDMLMYSESKLALTIRKAERAIRIVLSEVRFVEIMELIPKGIILSCYSFPMLACPTHLKAVLCFDKASQFISERDMQVISVFYIDGTMGFELLVFHGSVHVEEVDAECLAL